MIARVFGEANTKDGKPQKKGKKSKKNKSKSRTSVYVSKKPDEK